MKQRILPVIMAALLAASLTSCGSTGGSDSSVQISSTASTGSENSVNAASQAPYTVKMVMAGDAKTEDCNQVAAAVSEITKEKFNTTVELSRFGFGTYTEQVNLMLSSGEKLDLLTNLGVDLLLAVNNGQILPMNELLKQYGQDMLADIPESDWACTTFDGEIYAVRNNKEHGGGYGYAVVTEILKETGIDPATIQTDADMEQLFQKVKELHPDMAPLASDNGSIGSFPLTLDNMGDGDNFGVLLNCLEENFEVVNIYATDIYKEIITRRYDWAKKDLIIKDGSTNSEQGVDLLATGKAFAMVTNTKPGVDLEREILIGKDITIIETVKPFAITGSISGNLWYIAHSSKEPGRAMQVLNEMYSNADVSNLVINGIENQHYVMVDKEKGVIDYPESGSTAAAYSSLGWAWPNQLISYTWASGSPTLWEETAQFNKEVSPSVAMGFLWNNANVLSEIAACKNVLTKYKSAMECGELNPEDTLPKLNDELYKAGLQRIIDDKQAQLDEWRKTR